MWCALIRTFNFLGHPLVHKQQSSILGKVMLKAALKNNLKEVKTFTMRNVDISAIKSIFVFFWFGLLCLCVMY